MTDAIREEPLFDRGYVQLIDYMGDETAVVDAARVSFGRKAENFTTEQNDKLLKYLRDHNHDSPFEMVTFKFRIKAPVVVWWHFVRHRMASYNFISGRYVPFSETEVMRVPDDAWRMQSKSNKQGSSGECLEAYDGVVINRAVEELYSKAFALYHALLDRGVAKEQARLVLPFAAVYYEAIVQINARSLMNFLKLRTGGDAQSEIRAVAVAMQRVVQQTHPKLFPESA